MGAGKKLENRHGGGICADCNAFQTPVSGRAKSKLK